MGVEIHKECQDQCKGNKEKVPILLHGLRQDQQQLSVAAVAAATAAEDAAQPVRRLLFEFL